MTTSNLWADFERLVRRPALQVGDVIAVEGGVATVQLPGDGVLQVRGEATVSDRVFVRDGLIEGPAPALPIELIEI